MKEDMLLEYQQSIIQIIQERTSWRRYQKRHLQGDDKARLLKAMSTLTSGLCGEKIIFQLVEKNEETITSEKLGAYGLISGSQSYIVGIIQESERAYVSYGYLLEQLVLKAQEIDLQSCWVGAFNREFFHEITTAPDELVPAICVVGYGSEKRSLLDRAARLSIGAHKRKPWEKLFFDGSFNTPLTQENAGIYAIPIEMLRIAPSAGNAQPWRVLRSAEKDGFHFYKQVTNPGYERKRLPEVDLGICMCHFELAARSAGLHGEWIINNPDIQELPPQTEYIYTWQSR